MPYANFKEAYMDDYPDALRIGSAIHTALDSLESQGILGSTYELWSDMCSMAWSFHVAARQE